MHCPLPVENSVDSVENLGISPAFFEFFPFVPICNYWIKECIIPLSIREEICYGNALWQPLPVCFLRKSYDFQIICPFIFAIVRIWKLNFVKTYQKTFLGIFPTEMEILLLCDPKRKYRRLPCREK